MATAPLTELVDEIRERKLSRNRHFKLMSRPAYRAAMRLKRYLDGLADELRAGRDSEELSVSLHRQDSDRLLLRLVRPRIQAERRCFLSHDELRCLLRHHPDVRPLIEREARLPREHPRGDGDTQPASERDTRQASDRDTRSATERDLRPSSERHPRPACARHPRPLDNKKRGDG